MDMGVTVLVGFRGHATAALVISRWHLPLREAACGAVTIRRTTVPCRMTVPRQRDGHRSKKRRAEMTNIYNHKPSLKVGILMGQSEK